jgi:hypothetical protein
MTIKFTNNATTTLASGINSSVTSLSVAAGTGTLFPTLTGADVFYATLANVAGTVEIVQVTARSTDTFTIVRGQDGTSATTWSAGDKVELRPTAAGLAAMAQTANNLSDLASATTARTNLGLGTAATMTGPSGTIVGTSDSQTLTSKTLTNPTVNNYTEGVVAIGNSSTSQTLALTNGTVQTVTMTGNCTFTMPTNVAGKSFILIATQDATGSRTATFTSVKWAAGTAPTLTTTATTGRDIFTFFADGTNWYGTVAQAFA